MLQSYREQRDVEFLEPLCASMGFVAPSRSNG